MRHDPKPFWHPMRPGFRLPARAVGLLLVVFVAVNAFQEGRFHPERFAIPLALILLSFSPPERRENGVSTGRFLGILSVVALLVIGLSWLIILSF
ncbi:MAG TPA: hypothetical protein VNQ90_03380 [Chthoniobacteraceae bacterium]|nr:hypothetical protein [Chthoniobacteraceae bacterium]